MRFAVGTPMFLGGNLHPDDPTALQPMEHDDWTRRYRHSFTACMVEAGHPPGSWVRIADGTPHGCLEFGPSGAPRWKAPDDLTLAESVRWWLAACRAEELCAVLIHRVTVR